MNEIRDDECTCKHNEWDYRGDEGSFKDVKYH